MKRLFTLFLIGASVLLNACSKDGGNGELSGNNTGGSNSGGGSGGSTPQVLNGFKYDDSFKATGNFATLLAIQSDGKIIIGNNTQIARLNSDGTLDNSFYTGSTSNGEFHAIKLQSDGKILLGGTFTSYSSQSKSYAKNYVLRLNNDGSIDTAFPQLAIATNLSIKNDVRTFSIQADNKILIGGLFAYPVSVNNYTNNLIRVTASGVYDGSFNYSNLGEVNCITGTSDNKFYLTGKSANRLYIGKINSNGSKAVEFNFTKTADFTMSRAINDVSTYGACLLIQSDGKVIVGGRFDNSVYNPTTSTAPNYSGIVRFNADGTIDNTFPRYYHDCIVTNMIFTNTRFIYTRLRDADKTISTVNGAVTILNKDISVDNDIRLTGYKFLGDGYAIAEKANSSLVFVGKTYDRIEGYDANNYPIVTYKGVVQLLKL